LWVPAVGFYNDGAENSGTNKRQDISLIAKQLVGIFDLPSTELTNLNTENETY
jgi:hypothetical protein